MTSDHSLCLSHPLNESDLVEAIEVPEHDVPALGAHSQGGGVSRVPFKHSDSAVKRAGSSVETVGLKGANEWFLEALKQQFYKIVIETAVSPWKNHHP